MEPPFSINANIDNSVKRRGQTRNLIKLQHNSGCARFEIDQLFVLLNNYPTPYSFVKPTLTGSSGTRAAAEEAASKTNREEPEMAQGRTVRFSKISLWLLNRNKLML